LGLDETYEAAKLKLAEDDCLPQLIWKIDVNGDALSLNARFLDYTGIPEDQIKSSNVFDPKVVHPDDLSASKLAFKAANENKEPFEVKRRLLGKDGNYKWMLTRGSPILDDKNEIDVWCGSCTDIDSTERVQVFDNFL
jgi:PAS domain S-box-containing protein